MEFYQILQEIMDEKGFKIPDVARACGLSDATVRSMITRKAKSVTLEVAFKLSAGLGVSLERLNGDSGKDCAKTKNSYSEIDSIFESLSPENRAKLNELALLYLNDQRKNKDTE